MKYTEIEEVNLQTKVPKGYLLAKRTQDRNWAVLCGDEITYVSSNFHTLLRHTDGMDEVDFVDGWQCKWQLIRGDFWDSMKRHTKNIVEISLQEALSSNFCINGIIGFLKNISGFDAAFIERIIRIYREDKLNKNDKNVFVKKYTFVIEADKMYDHLEDFIKTKIYE